jgi:hypothetical protein
VACCAALAAAWATYAFVEKPVRRRFRSTPGVIVTQLVAAMAIVLSVAGVYSVHGLPGRWSDPGIRSLLVYKFDVSSYRPRTCHLEADQDPSAFATECFFSENPATRPRLLLWGDSAAAALYPGVESLNKGAYDIAQLTASVRPPFIEGYITLAIRPNRAATNDSIFKYIERTRPDAIIISSWPDYDINYRKDYAATIARLKAAGVYEIIIVGPPPLWPEPLPRLILRNHFNHLGRTIPDRVRVAPDAFAKIAKLNAELAAVAQLTDVLYVSAFRRLCSEDGACLAVLDGQPTAWDGFHLTTGASTLIVRDIFAVLASGAQKRAIDSHHARMTGKFKQSRRGLTAFLHR